MMRQDCTFQNPPVLNTPIRTVYDTTIHCVKHQIQDVYLSGNNNSLRISIFIVICYSTQLIGCAANHKRLIFPQTQTSRSIVVVRYDVEPLYSKFDRAQVFKTIRHDLIHIKALGFQYAILSHVDQSDRPDLLHLSKEIDLPIMCVIPRNQPSYHQPAPVNSADNAYISASTTIERHSNSLQSNTKKSVSLLNKQGLMSNLAVIDANGYHPNNSTTTHLLSQYHRELLNGRTGGMIVDGFRQMTNDSPDAIKLENPLTTAQRSALVRLIDYVKDRSSRLNGMNVKSIAPVEQRSDIATRMFFRGRRRYILIVNTRKVRYARGSVVFAANSLEGLATRAIEIPSMGSQPVGRVIILRKNTLSLPIALRPGDAALFELFSWQ